MELKTLSAADHHGGPAEFIYKWTILHCSLLASSSYWTQHGVSTISVNLVVSEIALYWSKIATVYIPRVFNAPPPAKLTLSILYFATLAFLYMFIFFNGLTQNDHKLGYRPTAFAQYCTTIKPVCRRQCPLWSDHVDRSWPRRYETTSETAVKRLLAAD